jgi:hypothetical protein
MPDGSRQKKFSEAQASISFRSLECRKLPGGWIYVLCLMLPQNHTEDV